MTCIGEASEGNAPPGFIGRDGRRIRFHAGLVQPFLTDGRTYVTLDARALDTRFHVACAIAREAGEVAKRRFLDRNSFTVGFKGPQDFLTEVDGEVERLIATRLHALFPEDGFIGEEGEGRVGREGAPSGSSTPSTAPRISRAARRISASRSPPRRTRNRGRRDLRPDGRRIVRRARTAPARRERRDAGGRPRPWT